MQYPTEPINYIAFLLIAFILIGIFIQLTRKAFVYVLIYTSFRKYHASCRITLFHRLILLVRSRITKDNCAEKLANFRSLNYDGKVRHILTEFTYHEEEIRYSVIDDITSLGFLRETLAYFSRNESRYGIVRINSTRPEFKRSKTQTKVTVCFYHSSLYTECIMINHDVPNPVFKSYRTYIQHPKSLFRYSRARYLYEKELITFICDNLHLVKSNLPKLEYGSNKIIL